MSASKLKPRSSDADRAVAMRLRQARITAGMTMQQLADEIGCTYQQISKYEFGINRISAGMLRRLATALGVHVGYLFEEPVEVPARAPRGLPDLVTIGAVLDDTARARVLAYARGELSLQEMRARVEAHAA